MPFLKAHYPCDRHTDSDKAQCDVRRMSQAIPTRLWSLIHNCKSHTTVSSNEALNKNRPSVC